MLSSAIALTVATSSPQFSSVKLPASIVSTARAAAQPMRRSVASQIEYWATLGLALEHNGLTTQEARRAIESYETAIKAVEPSVTRLKIRDTEFDKRDINELQAFRATIKAQMLEQHLSGRLQRGFAAVVAENAAKAIKL